jgi:hypothetical protein
MKKLIPAIMLLALGLSSCAVKTVSRSELLTPTLATAMNTSELTDMKYYGSDTEYDYFVRGYTRYRVLKSENALPDSARFNFDNWKTSKLYRDCLKDSVGSSLVNKLQDLLNKATANGTTAQTLPSASTTTSTTTQTYQPRTQTGKVLQGMVEQYKAAKAANQQ